MNTQTKSNHQFECPPDMVADVQIVFAGEYNPPIEIPAPKTVLDIGANVGAFSAWARSRWPDAKISAIEPLPDLQDLLAKNVTQYGVDIHPIALAKKDAKPVMFRGVNCSGGSSMLNLGWQKNEEVAITTKTPQEFSSEQGSFEFIKLDCEGMEADILEGLDLSKTNYIALEWHTTWLRDKVHAILRHDFQCVKSQSSMVKTGTCGKLIYIRKTLDCVKDWQCVFLAIPLDHGQTHGFTESLIKLLLNPPLRLKRAHIFNDSLVPRARNTLATDFLHSYECTGMLCIDSDLKFSPEQVKRICSHRQDAIVAGCYAKKMKGPAQWVLNADPDHQTPDENGLQKIRLAGTGFMYAPRIVLETMAASYPEIAYIPDHKQLEIEYDFFSVGVYKGKDHPAGKPGRYMSEDWFFCQRALDIGISVYADTRVVPWHTGEIDFPLEAATPLDNSAKEQAANGGVIPPLGVFPPEPGVTA